MPVSIFLSVCPPVFNGGGSHLSFALQYLSSICAAVWREGALCIGVSGCMGFS